MADEWLSNGGQEYSWPFEEDYFDKERTTMNGNKATVHIPVGHSSTGSLSEDIMTDLAKDLDWLGSRFNVVAKPEFRLAECGGMQNVVVTGLPNNIRLARPEVIKILQFHIKKTPPATSNGPCCNGYHTHPVGAANGIARTRSPEKSPERDAGLRDVKSESAVRLQFKQADKDSNGVVLAEPVGRNWELLYREVTSTDHEATIRIPVGRSTVWKLSGETMADLEKDLDRLGCRLNVVAKSGVQFDAGVHTVVVKGLPSNVALARSEVIQILQQFQNVVGGPGQPFTPRAPQNEGDSQAKDWRGYLKERKEIIETSLAMNALGINQGTSGNVSIRVPGGFLITPSGIPYDGMTPDQVVYVDDEGGYYGEFLPSSEWRMHKDIYTNTPAAKAIVHTHSTFATALSCQRRPIPAFHYMVGAAGGKTIPCADYGTFGTQELSDHILTAMREAGTRACLMANHGVICHSATLKKALGLAVEIECLAKQYNYACTFGPPVILDDAEMDIILAKFKTYGKQMADIKCMGCFDQTHAVVPPPRRDKPTSGQ